MREFDALVALNVDRMLDEVQPRTVFNCIAYGAYSFETDGELILRTNLMSTHALLERLTTRNIAAYIHAGSSSEYGENAAGPEEHDFLAVNSEYAVSKAACAHLIHYYGKQHGLPSANLRLYSVYGPLEDPSRLMPKIVQHGVRGELPPLVDPHIARDFVYSDDVVDAFIAAASELREDDYGDSFNVGTGRQTTIGELAEVARELYGIEQPATFTMPPRRWDVGDWYANSARAQKVLGWEAHTPLEDGLERMTSWYRGLPNPERYRSTTKEVALDAEHSITAVIACYRDGEAIPVMYRRLTDTFRKLGVDYEIIFVNDASPDDSEQVIREISERDRRVLGISHSRNFGSQAAFRSGMELATKNAVVLLDGDLQDPPELIEQFVEQLEGGLRRRLRAARLARDDVVHAARLPRVLLGLRPLLVPLDPARRRRLLADGPPRRARDAAVRRARPLPARRARLRRLPPDGRRLRAAEAHVRRDDEQPAAQHRLGQEGHLLVQQRAADDAQLRRHGALPAQPRARRGAGRGARGRARQRAARRRHGRDPRAAVRLAQPVRDRPRGRVPGARLRGGQAAAAVRAQSIVRDGEVRLVSPSVDARSASLPG